MSAAWTCSWCRCVGPPRDSCWPLFPPPAHNVCVFLFLRGDAVQAESDEVIRLREQLRHHTAAHMAQVADLQRKLQWYVENQEMVNKDEALVKQQGDEIKALREQLAQHTGKTDAALQKKLSAALRRNKSLEKQVRLVVHRVIANYVELTMLCPLAGTVCGCGCVSLCPCRCSCVRLTKPSPSATLTAYPT